MDGKEVASMSKPAQNEQVTTLYVRNIPVDIARQIKVLAAERSTNVAGVITAAVEHFAARQQEAPTDDDAGSLQADMQWYRRHQGQLLRDYEGRYVAILNQQVIDHDASFGALSRRVFARLGNRPVYMPKVERKPPEPRLRSPRINRR